MFTIAKRYSWVVFMFLLAACSSPSPATGTPTEVDINAISTQAVMTAAAQMTQTAAPTPYPTGTVTRTPAPTLTPLPLVTLEGLRVAYVIDGNLYVQDSGGQPVQLTDSGQDRNPILSDDGQKIVFYRGEVNQNNNIYSINADGSQEQAIIKENWLTALGPGTMAGSLTFVPKTHRLLFITYPSLCGAKPGSYVTPTCEISLYLADTGKAHRLLASGLKGDLRVAPFSVSPDGKLLSIATMEHMDIFGIDGQVIRRNILTYTPTESGRIFPRQYWLPNSLGLVVILPVDAYSDPTVPINYTVWRYMLDQNKPIQTSLDPRLTELGCNLLVSPDRNWVIYETSGGEMYVGNLKDGQTHKYSFYGCPRSWRPDSKYFVYDQGDDAFLGALGESPIPLGRIGISGWIDMNTYLYGSIYRGGRKNILIGKINGKTISNYESDILLPPESMGFTFVVLGK